ncbi:activated RNA polymerase II transcriptional coactivator p15-like protein [Flagelloscypha sp. PMI_526]|nr:activated RNA polymerase II transcriptional coactivator p15-like protein [Flagelloscypha sp. PMI_526]
MGKRKASTREDDASEDSDPQHDSGSEDERPQAKKAKKDKVEKKGKEVKKSKETKKVADGETSTGATVQTGDNGESYIELGKMKRLSVTSFKGKLYVNIREFYTDKGSGEVKPGKKGIMLTTEQWDILKVGINDIDELIASTPAK